MGSIEPKGSHIHKNIKSLQLTYLIEVGASGQLLGFPSTAGRTTPASTALNRQLRNHLCKIGSKLMYVLALQRCKNYQHHIVTDFRQYKSSMSKILNTPRERPRCFCIKLRERCHLLTSCWGPIHLEGIQWSQDGCLLQYLITSLQYLILVVCTAIRCV